MRVVLQGSLEHFAAKELLTFLGGSHTGTFDAESGEQRLRLVIRDGHIVSADAVGDVAKLLAWSAGTFTFVDDVVLPENASSADIATVIAEAEERNAEARSVSDLYPDDGVKFRVVNRPPGEINITAEEFQILFQIGTGKSLAQLRVDGGRNAVDLYPIIKRLQMTGLIEQMIDADDTARGSKPAPAPPPPLPPPAHKSEPAPAPLPAAEPDLVGTLTADDGTMHPLLEETSTIGRTPANTIALRDVSVSAKHAQVIRTTEGFLIEDVGSRNGTYINSEKLSERRLLADGDLVRLGKIILTFNIATDIQKKQSTEREMMK